MGANGQKSLRVLAADDSVVMREALRAVFAMHRTAGDRRLPPMELLEVAGDGVEALAAVQRLKPDALVLDMEMPRLNGLGVLSELRRTMPELPVILCSAHTERGARATLEGLAAGASDYVMKPAYSRDVRAALDALARQLLPKVAALASQADLPGQLARGLRTRARSKTVRDALATTAAELVVIGVSTGGPAALEQVLPALGQRLAAPVMVVQHMPRVFTGALAARLDGLCGLRVCEASDAMSIAPGTVYLAPGDAHMEVASGAGKRLAVRLHQGPARHSCRPSVEYLFESAARICGDRTLALVMTGMGCDGLEGARAVRDAGGTVLAQDEETSAVWGMPGRVLRDGVAQDAIALGDIAGEIRRRVDPAAGMMAGQMPSGETRREVACGLLR